MTKELTDESVALALGWTGQSFGLGWEFKNQKGNVTANYCPHFTTSLDAITGEIERRKDRFGDDLDWSLSRSDGEYCCFIMLITQNRNDKKHVEGMAPTAPPRIVQGFNIILGGEQRCLKTNQY